MNMTYTALFAVFAPKLPQNQRNYQTQLGIIRYMHFFLYKNYPSCQLRNRENRPMGLVQPQKNNKADSSKS